MRGSSWTRPCRSFDRLLDYRVPDGLVGVIPGVRVSVPLRSAKRMATAFVVEIAADGDFPGPLSDVAAVVSPIPVLRPEVWRLARAVADRAAGSANDVLRLAIPPRQVRVETSWLTKPPPAVVVPSAPEITGYPTLADALAADERVALRVQPGVTTGTDGTPVARWALTLAQAATRTFVSGSSAILVAPDHRDQTQLRAGPRGTAPARRDSALGFPAAERRSLPGSARRGGASRGHRGQSVGGLRPG